MIALPRPEKERTLEFHLSREGLQPPQLRRRIRREDHMHNPPRAMLWLAAAMAVLASISAGGRRVQAENPNSAPNSTKHTGDEGRNSRLQEPSEPRLRARADVCCYLLAYRIIASALAVNRLRTAELRELLRAVVASELGPQAPSS
jgi:hypothetical protein